MSYKIFTGIIAGAAILGGCQNKSQENNVNKPNVILIYTDDLGIGDLSCYGATKVSTPHIDRLAGEGLRFTNAYATSAMSTPSRYGMLTGFYPWRKAIPELHQAIPACSSIQPLSRLQTFSNRQDTQLRPSANGIWVSVRSRGPTSTATSLPTPMISASITNLLFLLLSTVFPVYLWKTEGW